MTSRTYQLQSQRDIRQCLSAGNASLYPTVRCDQWRRQDLEVGGTGSLGDGSPPAGPGAEPLVGCSGGEDPRKRRIFGYQTVLSFVYLAKLHEPLVKHEKNLGCSACLFAELSSN